MSTYRDRGIVLATKVLRDADRHYTFLTERHGKITVLAKGSRKARSKMSPHLASFGLVDLMIARGKLIDRLAGASLARAHRNIVSDFDRSAVAQSFLMILDAFVKRDLPDERVFGIAADFLAAVDRAPVDRASGPMLYHAASMKLLDALGYALELAACVRCRAPLVPEGNGFSPERGGIECRACRSPVSVSVSSDAIKALRFLRGASYGDAVRFRLAARPSRELSAILDVVMSLHLETRIPSTAYLAAVL